MTVTFDVASLPRDGVFRFDENNVEIPDSSKEQMKLYMCGELRKMLMGFSAHPPTASNLLTPQQLVQIDFFAPAAQHAASCSTDQASTGSGVVGAV
eukprot:4741596-Pleurochrysis_carterae.AAC.1